MSESETNLVIQYIDDKSIYCRSHSKQSGDLCNYLGKCHSTKKSQNLKAIVVPSGMAAISTVMHTLLMEYQSSIQVNIIMGDELYCDTERLVKYLKPTYKYNYCEIDVNNTTSIIKLFEETFNQQTNILFLESCSNPSGDIFDWTILPKLRKLSKKLYVVVDNTWLTHVIFNPFEYDVDITLTSLTKYYSSGKCIAGAIITNKKLYSKMFDYVRVNGLHVSPVHCLIISQTTLLMDKRLSDSSELTVSVAKLLASNDNIIVRHTSLPTDLSNPKAEKFFNKVNKNIIYPSVISFIVPLNKIDAISWMKSINMKYETSYGSAESRFDSWPEAVAPEHTMCRLAIGYEDSYERLYNEFKDKINF